MSTLNRGDQIEADFYRLKAQERAISQEQAKSLYEGLEAEIERLNREIEKLRVLLDAARLILKGRDQRPNGDVCEIIARIAREALNAHLTGETKNAKS